MNLPEIHIPENRAIWIGVTVITLAAVAYFGWNYESFFGADDLVSTATTPGE